MVFWCISHDPDDKLRGSEKVGAGRQAEALKTRNLQARVLMFGKEMFLRREQQRETS